MLDPIVPQGARVGQSDCRTASNTTIALNNFREFPDACNHLHVDLAHAEGPLRAAAD